MHIFLVNDDGIEAEGLRALCDACVARGHAVTVCAPHTQRSASSHRITLADPIYVRQADDYPAGVQAWSISGTPADCVRLGLYELVDKPVDVVISGINKGHNAGMAVHYSGTVGAAREGVLNHIPSIATSAAYEGPQSMLHYLAQLTVHTAEVYVRTDVPPQTVLSINAPDCEVKDMRPPVVAALSTAGYRDCYIRRESPRAGTYYWLTNGCELEPPAEGTDVALLREGHITFTYLSNPGGNDALQPEFVAQFAAIEPYA
ncbi:MAG TPA: 5'/3'-nucleotidase SurE [Candidatus Limiplasma sp.]|nr:5'/3'-nucleotidase SurE [Candidatus Limiplasma sp.]